MDISHRIIKYTYISQPIKTTLKMKTILRLVFLGLFVLGLFRTQAQVRYIDEVFSDVQVTSDVPYGSNYSLLPVLAGVSTVPLEVPLVMDVYEPVGDTEAERPVVMITHAGDFLPAVLNLTPYGSKTDSALVALCMSWAKRGYVAVSVEHRTGWNPAHPDALVRTQGILEASVRATQDLRSCIRFFRKDAREGGNTFRIDSTRFAVGGEDAAGFASMNVAFLDDLADAALPKFLDFSNNPPTLIIDTLVWGNIYGTKAGLFSVANHVGYSSDISMAFTLQGGLGDFGWMEAGDPPVVGVQNISDWNLLGKRDVVAGSTGDILFADGAWADTIVAQQNALGNNDAFMQVDQTHPMVQAAMARSGGLHGMLVLNTPRREGEVQCDPTAGVDPDNYGNNVDPWSWYNEQWYAAAWSQLQTSSPTVEICRENLGNPNDASQSKTYIDTLATYLALHMVAAMGIDTSTPTGPTEVTIAQIQEVSPANLAACDGNSSFLGDTVTTTGIVVMAGGLAQSAGGRQIWIQDGPGPWNGLDVRHSGGAATTPTDMLDLQPGDSVRITGVITNFQGESQIDPLTDGVEVLDGGKSVWVSPVSVGDLNDDTRTNNLETGEQWEGVYVEIYDVTVSNVSFFASNTRVSFNVQDAAGNLMNISDRFLAQRLPANGGTFVPPSVGTVFDTIRGVIAHSQNGCTGSGGRGYEMFPFDETDYVRAAGNSPPQVADLDRNPTVPTSSEDANISATIEDVDGSVVSATLYYAIGVSDVVYQPVAMTNDGGSGWSAAIPNTAYSDGDFVKYYICAVDNDSLMGCFPDVPGGGNAGTPKFFVPRDNGAQIRDLQFTPYSNGNSGYTNLEVTVDGVVISSAEADNLGTVFIQQAGGLTGWAGIQVVENSALATLAVGDYVRVTGTVAENFGLTRIQNTSSIEVLGSDSVITPLEIDPGIFSFYSFEDNEQYESMLIRLKNAAGGNIFVVDANADAPNNFAEYRVGTDVFDPNSGSRVLAGRNTGSAPGSLNFSYVNDSSWATNSGVMNVDPVVVQYEDPFEYMQGVMFYSFGNMKLLPRNNADAVFLGVNIEDEWAGSELVLYPNPTADNFKVKYSFPKAVKAQFTLVDLMGRQLAQQAIHQMEGEASFSVAQLARGTYMLMIQVEGIVLDYKKILVNK